MDRAVLEEHLAMAERHVRQGQAAIARQSALVEKLRLGGHDAIEAQRLLVQFETLMALHMQDRDRIRAELDSSTRT